MNDTELNAAAINIAGRLKVELKAGRIANVVPQHIRCAVVGYLVGQNISTGFLISEKQVADLLDRTLQELVGMPS